MSAKITNNQIVYNGFFKMHKLNIKETLPSGEESRYIREVMVRGHASAVVIRDPKTDELVFTKQFRTGSAINGKEDYILDIVAGMIDPNDDALETAIREAGEEVGAKDLKNIIQTAPTFYPSIGGCSEQMTVYYAEADLSNLPKYKGEKSENEFIEVIKMPTEQALSDLSLFPTSASMVGLMWLLMQRQLGNYN